MSTPTMRELIERATPGPWSAEHWPERDSQPEGWAIIGEGGYGVLWTDKTNFPDEANRQLIARCNPATMRLVMEALTISERYLWSIPLDGALDAHAKVESALAALNGQPEETK